METYKRQTPVKPIFLCGLHFHSDTQGRTLYLRKKAD